MTNPAGLTTRELESVVESYRIRSEVVRETVRDGERRRTIGLEVRLWATLPPGASHLPDTPDCRAAVRATHHLAEAVVAGDARLAAEIEPFHNALYDSRQHPGCDEIYLAIRPPLPYGNDGADESREASLSELRRRLEALGVFEGRWRPRSEPGQAGGDVSTTRPSVV